MEKTKELWSRVISSENATAEAKNIEAVRKLISSKDMTILVQVNTNQGKMVNINTLTDNEVFSKVKISFSTDKGEFLAPEWSPKDRENVFLLLLE